MPVTLDEINGLYDVAGECHGLGALEAHARRRKRKQPDEENDVGKTSRGKANPTHKVGTI